MRGREKERARARANSRCNSHMRACVKWGAHAPLARAAGFPFSSYNPEMLALLMFPLIFVY